MPDVERLFQSAEDGIDDDSGAEMDIAPTTIRRSFSSDELCLKIRAIEIGESFHVPKFDYINGNSKFENPTKESEELSNGYDSETAAPFYGLETVHEDAGVLETNHSTNNSNQCSNGNGGSPKSSAVSSPHLRGHARHSSYDVGPSLLSVGCGNGRISTPTSYGNNLPQRTSSFTKQDAASLSSSYSISSLSYYSDSHTSIEDENSSKRSSLDRRSQASYDIRDYESDASGKSRFGAILSKGFLSWIRAKEAEKQIRSTSGLILVDRPGHLPAKSSAEAEKHRQLYEQLVESAKKKEAKEAKLRKKRIEEQWRKEDAQVKRMDEWNALLPQWEAVKNNRRTRELWWEGIPSSVRGKVWKLAIGNELNITPELYEICVMRANDRLQAFCSTNTVKSNSKLPGEAADDMNANSISMQTNKQSPTDSNDRNRTSSSPPPSSPIDQERTVELIHLDVSRTFPHLGIFQKGGPYYDMLLNLLGAYVCYRPDVGYVQGMSFLAAVLLLNMDIVDAFIAFANLLNRPAQRVFFQLQENNMQHYFNAYDAYFETHLPKLYNHFKELNIAADLYLIEWLYTLYAKSLPLDVACRIWDVFFRDGEEFLFRTSLGILHLYEPILLTLDFDQVLQFLTHLPDNLSSNDLFQSITTLKLNRDRRRFSQILSDIIENKSL